MAISVFVRPNTPVRFVLHVPLVPPSAVGAAHFFASAGCVGKRRTAGAAGDAEAEYLF